MGDRVALLDHAQHEIDIPRNRHVFVPATDLQCDVAPDADNVNEIGVGQIVVVGESGARNERGYTCDGFSRMVS